MHQAFFVRCHINLNKTRRMVVEKSPFGRLLHNHLEFGLIQEPSALGFKLVSNLGYKFISRKTAPGIHFRVQFYRKDELLLLF